MLEKELWEKCIEFHGHECGGIAAGFRAALYAKKVLGHVDHVTAYTKKCPVDAFPVVLGCSRENGRLTVENIERVEFIFENEERSLHVAVKSKPNGAPQGSRYWLEATDDELFI